MHQEFPRPIREFIASKRLDALEAVFALVLAKKNNRVFTEARYINAKLGYPQFEVSYYQLMEMAEDLKFQLAETLSLIIRLEGDLSSASVSPDNLPQRLSVMGSLRDVNLRLEALELQILSYEDDQLLGRWSQLQRDIDHWLGSGDIDLHL